MDCDVITNFCEKRVVYDSSQNIGVSNGGAGLPRNLEKSGKSAILPKVREKSGNSFVVRENSFFSAYVREKSGNFSQLVLEKSPKCHFYDFLST